MAVKVARYRHAGAIRWGVVRGDRIAPLDGVWGTTGDFLAGGGRAAACERAARDEPGALAVGEVEVLSPVTRNQQLLCQATNYRSHLRESGMDPDHVPHNVFFRKASSCIVPASSDVVRPAHVQLLDYEIELGLVLGREITGPVEVAPATLHEVLAALVIVNDVSARDVQLPQGQFYKGKSYRTFGPVGPWLALVDAADLARLDQLELRLWVNDELRQSSDLTDMVWKPAPTLTELSGLQDLFPGDLISTGTPGGCALQAPNAVVQLVGKLLPEAMKWSAFLRAQAGNPKFLKPGDRMRASIRTADAAIDLGTQENRIVAG